MFNENGEQWQDNKLFKRETNVIISSIGDNKIDLTVHTFYQTFKNTIINALNNYFFYKNTLQG